MVPKWKGTLCEVGIIFMNMLNCCSHWVEHIHTATVKFSYDLLESITRAGNETSSLIEKFWGRVEDHSKKRTGNFSQYLGGFCPRLWFGSRVSTDANPEISILSLL